MMLEIRKFGRTEDEYLAIVDIVNALWPEDPRSVEAMKYEDDSWDEKYLHGRFVGEIEGSIIATGTYGEMPWMHVPGKYFVHVSVHPDFQRRGIGSALYERIVDELSSRDPIELTSDTRDSKPESIRFLKNRGFQEKMTINVSHLDVTEFDPARFAWAEEKMDKLGVKIYSADQLDQLDPEWKPKAYELNWEVFKDVPLPDPPTKQPYEQFLKWFSAPFFFPPGYLVAIKDDDYIGLSGLWLSLADKTRLQTGLTGTVRKYRRKGVATAMKARGVALAKERGITTIQTENEENNPMYDLNVQLGFKPKPRWLVYTKAWKEEDKNAETE
jgi:GNAT superfamily N-acetyltransferase